ncbi:hypothetical protein F7R25_03840 [Burkholderia stagnalis]|uniref:Uncharacterized protein n=1 Tax=Burkholderia stagnalis TaxID=1503054 RepID=A0A6L3N2Y0_9BURK|nr:hypothetical protein [Burkholderia stagnalis]KAB0640636.1 hypothetical protein F7R25_03840 [Burkholderia stagnalis]VWB05785.1 hypothetical protein BST28156_00084 [Burkholderia stagnalis]
MDFEELYCELRNAGIDPVLKNGKVYFNGEYNGKNFVRYIYQNKDTLELCVFVCINKKFGEEQTQQDRSDSARERNRWIRDEFNKWGLSFKFPEWRPEGKPQSSIPATAPKGGSLPQIKSTQPTTTKQVNKDGIDGFDWDFVDKPAKDDDNFDPFADPK